MQYTCSACGEILKYTKVGQEKGCEHFPKKKNKRKVIITMELEGDVALECDLIKVINHFFKGKGIKADKFSVTTEKESFRNVKKSMETMYVLFNDGELLEHPKEECLVIKEHLENGKSGEKIQIGTELYEVNDVVAVYDKEMGDAMVKNIEAWSNSSN